MGQNVALVTQSLLVNANAALSRREPTTFAQVADLFALCEAVVLLDEVRAIRAARCRRR